MRTRRILVAIALLAVGLLMAPGAAQAKPLRAESAPAATSANAW